MKSSAEVRRDRVNIRTMAAVDVALATRRRGFETCHQKTCTPPSGSFPASHSASPRMTSRRMLALLAVSVVMLVACDGASAPPARQLVRGADSAAPLEPERAVRQLVALFAARMRTVSLVAPDSIAASRLQEAYGTLVTPDLLSDWMARPTAAPGRRISSPSPDRLDVRTVQPAGVDEYLVTGALIYGSRAPGAGAVRVAPRPVRLHVRRSGDGTWRISMFEQPATSVSAS